MSTQAYYTNNEDGNDYESCEPSRNQRPTAKKRQASLNSNSSQDVGVQADPTSQQIYNMTTDAATLGEITLLRSKVLELESQMTHATNMLHTLTQTLLLQQKRDELN